MWNGIKPTRLWHKTGKVHMKNMLNARYSARLVSECDRVYNQRKRPDMLAFYTLVMSSAAFAAYMFGVFSPPNDCTKNKKDEVEEECRTQPCPRLKPPTPPQKCPKRS